jgi:hypothetical protein
MRVNRGFDTFLDEKYHGADTSLDEKITGLIFFLMKN